MSEEIKKRRGRPKKDSLLDEVEVLGNNKNTNPILDVPNNDIPNNDIPINQNTTNDNTHDVDNDSDIKSFLKDKKPKPDINNSISTESNDGVVDEIDAQIAEFENKQGVNDIPDNEYNPLSEPVKQRAYTDGGLGLNNENTVYNQKEGEGRNHEKVISEPNYTGSGSARKPDIDATLINPSREGEGVLDIEDNNWNGNNNSSSSNSSNKKGNTNSNNNNNNNNSPKPQEKSDNLKELSPKEKREATEKTAEAILLAYKQYVPIPFVYFSTYSQKKLEKLHNDDEIDLETQIKRDGTTFREYTKDFNEKVEEAFEVSDAEVEMLREPLVDVLMEQEIAFTPMQTLLFTAGQIMVGKVMLCVKFLRDKKSDIEEMKEIHRENMEKMEQIRYEHSQNKTTQQQPVQQQPVQQQPVQQQPIQQQPIQQQPINNPTQQTSDSSNLTIVKEEKHNEDETGSEKDIIKPTLEDALNMEVTEVTEENNGDSSIEPKHYDIPN